MPTGWGATNGSGTRLSFTRRDVRRASRALRAEYEDVNPHAFYRGLWERLFDLRGHEEDRRYEVEGERSRDLQVENPAVGERTGVVTGRMQATSNGGVGRARIHHRPWGPQAAAATVLGLIVLPLGLVHGAFLLVGPLLILGGLAAFAHQREGEVPLRREDVLTILLEGEARENVRDTERGRRSELASDLGVVYTADVFLAIQEEGISELSWSLRTELAHRMTKWEQTIADRIEHEAPSSPVPQESPSVGFFDALEGWVQLDGEAITRDIQETQRRMRQHLAKRQAHARILSTLRQADVHDRELERVEAELETLENEMSAYVEHRGFASMRASTGELDTQEPPSRRR